MHLKQFILGLAMGEGRSGWGAAIWMEFTPSLPFVGGDGSGNSLSGKRVPIPRERDNKMGKASEIERERDKAIYIYLHIRGRLRIYWGRDTLPVPTPNPERVPGESPQFGPPSLVKSRILRSRKFFLPTLVYTHVKVMH